MSIRKAVRTAIFALIVSSFSTLTMADDVKCESAWGPDADRHAKLLINREAEGSLLEAYLHQRYSWIQNER